MNHNKTLSEILEMEIRLRFKNVNKFAEESGIPYMTISSVLKRGVEKTTVGTLEKICEALDITITYLFLKQKCDTIHAKLINLPATCYTNKDIIQDLIDFKLLDMKVECYTEQELERLAEVYRRNLTRSSSVVFTDFD